MGCLNKKQLEMVSNNREYDTLSKEIEFQELEIELCSKKIREAQQMINERLYDLHKAEDQKADREKGLVMKRSELESIMAETREEEENLKEKAFELEKKIEPRLLQSFKRIRMVQGWTSRELGKKERRIVPYILSIVCYFGCFFSSCDYILAFKRFHSICLKSCLLYDICHIKKEWLNHSSH